MRVPGLKTLERHGRWLRSRVETRALILGYHRIDDPQEDPYGLCTPPERFREHLEVLAEEAHPISAAELIDGLDRDSLPRGSVLVTLDDGYADALHTAKPALEAIGVPAVVFVTTGLLDSSPWWERLAHSIPESEALPEQVALEVEGRRLDWSSQSEGVRERSELVLSLHHQLARWPPAARDEAIRRLSTTLGEGGVRDELPRGLTRRELELLSGGGSVEIGAHGVHHSLLGECAEQEQRREIRESKRVLEEALGDSVRAFSYPSGSNSPLTRSLVRESGFVSAFGSYSGVATPSVDRYQLPRFWAGGMAPDALRRLIRHWR